MGETQLDNSIFLAPFNIVGNETLKKSLGDVVENCHFSGLFGLSRLSGPFRSLRGSASDIDPYGFLHHRLGKSPF